MTEWSDRFNPFNSYLKGMSYIPWYKAILRGEFLPPIEASVDPSNNCNLNCIWCNGKDIIDREKSCLMTTEHLMELMEFFANWGVKAVCFAGGGEPLMHPSLHLAMGRCKERGMETSIITNGTLFERHAQPMTIVHSARWVGVSVDAATSETYHRIKGQDLFHKVLYNIANLVDCKEEIGSDCEISFKFLIHPENQHEIFRAAKIARRLGCNVFHARPVAQLYANDKERGFDLPVVIAQLNAIRKLDTETFRAFGIMHKYDEHMHTWFPFEKCHATPVMCMFEANGDVNLCIDRKGDPGLRLCSHENTEDVRAAWGSEHHKALIEAINIEDCPKCTFNTYNQIVEQAVLKDGLCWKFT